MPVHIVCNGWCNHSPRYAGGDVEDIIMWKDASPKTKPRAGEAPPKWSEYFTSKFVSRTSPGSCQMTFSHKAILKIMAEPELSDCTLWARLTWYNMRWQMTVVQLPWHGQDNGTQWENGAQSTCINSERVQVGWLIWFANLASELHFSLKLRSWTCRSIWVRESREKSKEVIRCHIVSTEKLSKWG